MAAGVLALQGVAGLFVAVGPGWGEVALQVCPSAGFAALAGGLALPSVTGATPKPEITLRFSHVAIVGKYQAPGSRDVVEQQFSFKSITQANLLSIMIALISKSAHVKDLIWAGNLLTPICCALTYLALGLFFSIKSSFSFGDSSF